MKKNNITRLLRSNKRIAIFQNMIYCTYHDLRQGYGKGMGFWSCV